MNEQRVSRRAMLRGLGVSMALPWLESVRPGNLVRIFRIGTYSLVKSTECNH